MRSGRNRPSPAARVALAGAGIQAGQPGASRLSAGVDAQKRRAAGQGPGLVEQLERGTPAAIEFARWRQRLAAGIGKFSEMAADGKVFPPLFVWMVVQSGEDLPAGFQRAAEIYQSRASYRAETLLYSALPCSVLGAGRGDSVSNPADHRGAGAIHEHARQRHRHDQMSSLDAMNSDPDFFLRLVLAALLFAVWVALLSGVLYAIHFFLTLPMRRAERARLFLDVLETALKTGQPVEEALISVARSHDLTMGVRFYILAAWLENNLPLGDALAKVPRFLPPQVAAMLRAGEKIGDLGKVLPACRQLLKDGLSKTRAAISYLVILTFVITPMGILVFAVMQVFIIPKFLEIADLFGATRTRSRSSMSTQWPWFWFSVPSCCRSGWRRLVILAARVLLRGFRFWTVSIFACRGGESGCSAIFPRCSPFFWIQAFPRPMPLRSPPIARPTASFAGAPPRPLTH